MIKFNLEKSLLRQNKRLATPEELLLIKEYDTHTELLENDALSRLGFNNTLKQGGRLKKNITESKSQTNNFSQDRVFHISQIEAICNKYYLRFLSAEYYKGIIDKDLPTKVTNFEAAYNVKCNSRNTKIVAPIESFRLQEKPKDPLLFYQINDEYYYLIHKWGNDLSVLRNLYNLLSNGLFCWLAIPVALCPLMLLNLEVAARITIGLSGIWSIVCGVALLVEGKPITFLKENDWDSHYRN